MSENTHCSPKDNLARYPMNSVLAFFWVVFGVLALAEGWVASDITHSPLSRMPQSLAIFIGVSWILAGVCLLWGVFTNDARLSLVFQVRKLAYIMGALSGGFYTFHLTITIPQNLMGMTTGLMSLTLGLSGLFSVILKEERQRKLLRRDGQDA